MYLTGIALVFASAHGAGLTRYTNAATPLLDVTSGKPMGSLGPGVALDVLGRSSATTHVAVHGWSMHGANAIVFAAPDRHIVLLSAFAGHVTLGTSQNIAGVLYDSLTIEGSVANSALADDVQALWNNARDLYVQSCGSCHALPATNAYSANQWPAILKTQAPNAGLDAEQTALLTTYLQVQSGR